MNGWILQSGGRAFQEFTAQLTNKLTDPTAQFVRHLVRGVLFSTGLILTDVASRVPQPGGLTAMAKWFRRQLANNAFVPAKDLLSKTKIIVRGCQDTEILLLPARSDIRSLHKFSGKQSLEPHSYQS